ncbi:MarR family transcriptional regulator, partial [Bacillus wiedmannii]
MAHNLIRKESCMTENSLHLDNQLCFSIY